MSDDAARRLAAALKDRGLAAPARLLVDAHRPLSPLLSDLTAAFGPLLAPVAGRAGADVATLLDDERGLEGLANELEPGRRTRAESG